MNLEQSRKAIDEIDQQLADRNYIFHAFPSKIYR